MDVTAWKALTRQASGVTLLGIQSHEQMDFITWSVLLCISNTPLAEFPALKATERNLGTGFLYVHLQHGG